MNLSKQSLDHKKHHIELHDSLDELCADYMCHTEKLLSETSVFDLMIWSYEQTRNPSEKE